MDFAGIDNSNSSFISIKLSGHLECHEHYMANAAHSHAQRFASSGINQLEQIVL